MRSFCYLVIVVLAVFIPNPAHAALIAYEGADYASHHFHFQIGN